VTDFKLHCYKCRTEFDPVESIVCGYGLALWYGSHKGRVVPNKCPKCMKASAKDSWGERGKEYGVLPYPEDL